MPDNAGMPWTRQQNSAVVYMYNCHYSLTHSAGELGRTEHAIHCKLKSLTKMGIVSYN